MIDDLKLNLAKLKDYNEFAKNLRDDRTGEIVKTDPWYYMEFSAISPEVIALSLSMIFPEFVEYNDCIFLKKRFSEGMYRFCVQSYGDDEKEYYERFINTIRLDELFNDKYVCWDDAKNYSYSIEFLGKVFERTWKRELEEKFKDRKFHVEYYECHNYGPTIYFHTIRE